MVYTAGELLIIDFYMPEGAPKTNGSQEDPKAVFDAFFELASQQQGGNINKDDVTIAINVVMRKAEAEGKPYTVAEVRSLAPRVQNAVIDALLARESANKLSRGPGVVVDNSTGIATGAENKTDARNKISEERASQ